VAHPQAPVLKVLVPWTHYSWLLFCSSVMQYSLFDLLSEMTSSQVTGYSCEGWSQADIWPPQEDMLLTQPEVCRGRQSAQGATF